MRKRRDDPYERTPAERNAYARARNRHRITRGQEVIEELSDRYRYGNLRDLPEGLH
jgi:hypothetical protein